MAWLAATFHDQLSTGTELAIFQEPWDPQAVLPAQLYGRAAWPITPKSEMAGFRASCPAASVDLGIDFPDGATAVVWARDVISSEAVIQTSDQIKWRMVLQSILELSKISVNADIGAGSAAVAVGADIDDERARRDVNLVGAEQEENIERAGRRHLQRV